MPEFLNVGDLTPLSKELEAVIQKHFGCKPGMAIAFTLAPKYGTAHWVTNVSRENGIKLFKETAAAMQSQLN